MGDVGFGGSRGSPGVWRIGWLRRPASDSRAQHIRVLLAPYPRTTASFGALGAWLRSGVGSLACVPSSLLACSRRAGLAPAAFAFVGQKQRGKPRSTKVRLPRLRFPPIEATPPTPPEDVVPWGSGASSTGMCCGRSSEPWTAEPSDAPDPQGTAAPSGASAVRFNPTSGPVRNRSFSLSTTHTAATSRAPCMPGAWADTAAP